MTNTEKYYSQIEKEALAIIFALKKKFHRMILGRKFIRQTDHRPLLSIFGSKKGIPMQTANRRQCWAMILLNYDFKMEFLSAKKIWTCEWLVQISKCKDTVIALLESESKIKS